MKSFFFGTHGRLNRARFWLGQFAVGLFFAVTAFGVAVASARYTWTGKKVTLHIDVGVIGDCVLLAGFGLALWSAICLGIRRYHDRDKPGVWVLIQFIPFVGGILFFVEAFCLRGTYGANPYGTDPLNPEVGSVEAARAARKSGTRSPPGRPGWVVPVLLMPAALSLLLVAAGIAVAVNTQTWLATMTQVEGKVVGLQPSKAVKESDHETFSAIVEATTPEGAPLRVTGVAGTNPAPTIGTTRRLAYPPGRPAEAIVADFWRLWFVPVVLSGLGGAGALFWLFVALLAKHLWTRELCGQRRIADWKLCGSRS